MRISDWSSDVCASDLSAAERWSDERRFHRRLRSAAVPGAHRADPARRRAARDRDPQRHTRRRDGAGASAMDRGAAALARRTQPRGVHSETRSRLRIRPGPSPPPESLFRMLNLKEYRGTADRLADHLPWAELVEPGVVLNKDGSFQSTEERRGGKK